MMKKRICLMLILFICVLVGCGNEKVYKKSTVSKCSNVTVKDITFKIPNIFLEKAKEIEIIDDTLTYENTYIKENEMEYYCFNLDSFIVYCFLEEKTQDDSLSVYIDKFYDRGLRITVGNDTISGSDFMNKPKAILETVYCEALLSQELYEDFTGKAAIIKDTYYDVCLFVGAKGREIELENDVEKVLDDVIYSLTSIKDASTQILDNIVVTEEIQNGKGATISILDENGELGKITLEEILVTENVEYDVPKEAPPNYEWCFVTLKGKNNLERVHIKVKDIENNFFDTGGRTYTLFYDESQRIDAYLIPKNTSYKLEFGNDVKISILTVE